MDSRSACGMLGWLPFASWWVSHEKPKINLLCLSRMDWQHIQSSRRLSQSSNRNQRASRRCFQACKRRRWTCTSPHHRTRTAHPLRYNLSGPYYWTWWWNANKICCLNSTGYRALGHTLAHVNFRSAVLQKCMCISILVSRHHRTCPTRDMMWLTNFIDSFPDAFLVIFSQTMTLFSTWTLIGLFWSREPNTQCWLATGGIFNQSSLSSAGLERVKWPRGKLERGRKKNDCILFCNWCDLISPWPQHRRIGLVDKQWDAVSMLSFQFMKF